MMPAAVSRKPKASPTLPRNAASIVTMRLNGQRPEYGVVVSFIGDTKYHPLPHVYCDGGKPYDFRFLAGLQIVVVTRPGIDIRDAARRLWDLYYVDEAQAYDCTVAGMPMLIDADNNRLFWISSYNPAAWMQAKPSHPAYQVMFPWVQE